MRMIGIGLMGFLLAGVALLLSTMNILEHGQRLVRNVTHGPDLVFEHRLATTAQGNHSVSILRSNPDHPVILSGFPAYQSVAFTFPKDARPTSGYLQIDATAQVLAGVEGVLRITITGSRRGELLLRPGEAGRSLQIPLSPSDFADDQLVVSFSLQGTNPHHQCGSEDGIAAIVEIETTSALHLTLDRSLFSPRDRFYAWGEVLRISWPNWLKPDEQVRRVVLGAKAKQLGIRTEFRAVGGEDALTTAAARDVLAGMSQDVTDPQSVSLSLANNSANAGLRRFYRKTAWRTRYALTGPDAVIPSHLDLHMAFGDPFGGHHWSLTVTLNNRLLLQETFEGRQLDYRTRVDLPAAWQQARNQIEVVATTSDPLEGVCDQGPELLAELLPEAQIVPGDQLFIGPASGLQDAIAHLDPIHVAIATQLTAMDAEHVANWLARVTSPDASLKPAKTEAHILIAGPTTPDPSWSDKGSTWIVTRGGDADLLNIRRMKPNDRLPKDDIFMLVDPSGLDLAGVAL